MNSAGGYSITPDDIFKVLHLLHDNGVTVQNSKKAYEELQRYQSNSTFFVLLSYLFGSQVCPIQVDLNGSWVLYRRLAGLTLKNNLERCKLALGESAIREAATCALNVLVNPTDVRIARVAAQIVAKITALTSFNWWEECGFGNLPHLLLNDLLTMGELKTLSALYALQYLVEDLPKEVGVASKDVVERVAMLVLNPNEQWNVRKAAFRMCSNMYEQGQNFDWNVESLSPLQEGLTSASRLFANVCTALVEQGCGGDIHLRIHVLRSCCLMLDYLEYFTPMDHNDMNRLVKCWIIDTISIVTSSETGEHNIQLKIAAMDLLTMTMELYDRMGGEGYVCALTQPLLESLPAIIPALVSFVPMTKEDTENIILEDDYRSRDLTAVDFYINEKKSDISDDAPFDEDHGTASLRSSALRCVDALCTFSSKQAFPYLIEEVRVLWDTEWQFREAAIVLVGTMASGCYNEIANTLPSVVQQLIAAVTSPSENIFVVSMALWSLSRVLEWAYLQEGNMIDSIFDAFVPCLRSKSKRVQQAAVTSINAAFTTAHNMGMAEKTVHILRPLVETVIGCLQFYNDANLYILCDLALHLVALNEDQNTMLCMSSAFRADRANRAKAFEVSYVACYINEAPNVFVDKDVFSLDRAIVGLLTRFPDPSISIGILDSWYSVLKDMVERNIKDDVGLLFNILFTCRNFVNVTSSAVLSDWSSRTQEGIAMLAFHIFECSDSMIVQTASVSLIHRLLKSIGPLALPQRIRERLLNRLTSSIGVVEDLHDKLELVRLITSMVGAYSHELTDRVFCAFTSAVGELRSDAFSDSQLLFAQMAYEICSALETAPGLVVHSRPDVLVKIITDCENAYDKSVATIHLTNALLCTEEVAVAILPDAIRLVCSWRQSASNFPGTHESLKSLLAFYAAKHPPLIRDQLSLMDPNIREMLNSLYDLSI